MDTIWHQYIDSQLYMLECYKIMSAILQLYLLHLHSSHSYTFRILTLAKETLHLLHDPIIRNCLFSTCESSIPVVATVRDIKVLTTQLQLYYCYNMQLQLVRIQPYGYLLYEYLVSLHHLHYQPYDNPDHEQNMEYHQLLSLLASYAYNIKP